jgi:thiamine-phosphate pyrophosphorylase
MPQSCLLYYITDRRTFPGDESAQRRCLLEKIAEAARCGVDYIQLRERDLPTRELEKLAREAVNIVRSSSQLKTALLINSRTDVALATQANGVHLRSDDILPSEVRKIWSCGAGTPFGKLRARPELVEGAGSARENSAQDPVIAVSCHSPREVARAARNAATFAVFAPVFEKNVFNTEAVPQPAGLSLLAEACQFQMPVLALGGITLENAHSCLEVGAAGIAAIRLFQENDIAEVTLKLRN